MTDTSKRGVPRWLEWVREIQSLAQTGLHFAPDAYHRERYHKLLDIATQIAVEYGGLPREPLKHVILTSHGYATPKVDVRGAVFRDGKILLVRERADGGWCMPGGWADVGESPKAMVEREVREESGLTVRAMRVIGVYDSNREGRPLDVFHAYKIVFLCEDQGGEPGPSNKTSEAGPSNETSEAGFFPLGGFPELSVMRTSLRHLRDAFARAQSPDVPAAFD